jgi:predicted AAA+ superfamily ATPase
VRFVLSGSANLLLMSQVTQTLAGRAIYLTLGPLAVGERARSSPPNILAQLLEGRLPASGSAAEAADPLGRIWDGSLPALLGVRSPATAAWWQGYIASYVERDLRQIAQISALADFRRVMALLAHRTGQLLNQSEVGRDAALSQSTVHRYANLLEAGELLVRLPAYTRSRSARAVKSPKIYWMDPGLPCALAGISDRDELSSHPLAGALFENLILLQLRSLAALAVPEPKLYFWRTQRGEEVDLVVERGRARVALEVKLTKVLGRHDERGLLAFLRDFPDTRAAVLVYRGEEVRRLGERLVAVPWTSFCLPPREGG